MAVLVILMSNLPVYVETKKAEELQAGVLHSDITSVNIKRKTGHYPSNIDKKKTMLASRH